MTVSNANLTISLLPRDSAWLLSISELPKLLLTQQPWARPSTPVFPDKFLNGGPQPQSVVLQGQSPLSLVLRGTKLLERRRQLSPLRAGYCPPLGLGCWPSMPRPLPGSHCFLYCHLASAPSLEFPSQRSGPLPHLRTPHTAWHGVSVPGALVRVPCGCWW